LKAYDLIKTLANKPKSNLTIRRPMYLPTKKEVSLQVLSESNPYELKIKEDVKKCGIIFLNE
jgi:hypothetical protein